MKKILSICLIVLVVSVLLTACELLHVHQYDEWSVTKAATCTEEGIKTRICSCGEKETVEIPPLGHKEETIEGKAPTCTEDGLTDGKVCKNCSVTLVEQEKIPVLGHDIIIDEAKAPTCTESGLTEGKHCDKCNYKIAQESVPALGHTAGDEADCLNAQICTVCKVVLAPAKGHTEVIDAAVDATCTATGLTEGKHCSACNEILVKQDVTPIIPHTYDDKYDESCNNCGFIRDAECAHLNTTVLPAKNATCTESGLTEGKVCAKCQEILIKQEIIPAKGHTEVIDKAIAPDCVNTGLTEGKHCSVCGEVFVKQETVSALGHTPGAEADCENAQICTVCKIELAPAKGHTEVIDEAKAPTCTEIGLTEGKHCSVCSEIILAQETIPALGHTAGAEADCENAQICTVCKVELAPAKGHTEVIDAYNAPNCTATGLTEGKHCSVCNKILVKRETIPALGHTEKDAVVENEKASSCTAEGSYDSVIYCAVCDEEIKRETKKIEMLPHSEVILPAIDATCTMSGATEGKYCSVCQNVLIEQTFIPAKDHNYIDGICDGCGEVDPNHYFVMTIPEALVADDGKMVAVSGTVCTINTIWTDTNNNFSVTIVDGEGNQLYIYKLTTKVELGDVITVYGAMATYNGNRQVGQGSTATINGHDSSYDYTEMTISEALAAPDNTNVIVEGIVVEIGIAYDSGYNNMSVYISTNGGARLYVYRLTGQVTNGDVIVIKGSMGTYNGQRQITGGTFEKIGEHDCFDIAPASCQNGAYCRFCGKSHGEPYDHKDSYDGNYLCDYDCGAVVPPRADSTLTIEKAIYLGGLYPNTVFSESKYYVTGKITSIVSTMYGNMYIQDENGNEIYIYGFYNADGSERFDAMSNKPAVGDMVTVYGIIGYYGVAEIKNAWMIERYPAVEGSIGLSYSLNEDGQSYTVTGRGVCPDNNIVIPAEYMGLPVTRIGEDAFANDEKITSVSIAESVIELGSWAFGGCRNLVSVAILSDSITTLPSRVFYYSAIKSIELPESIKVIDRYAFQSCYYLETIYIPKGLESIGTEAFDGCPITTVYYGGSEADWANISIVDYCNDAIKNASKVYDYVYGE